MDYDLFIAELKAANLTGKDFARLLKLNQNSISNCKSKGEVPDHLAVIAVLIRTLAENNIDYAPALARVKLKEKKPRGKNFEEGRVAAAATRSQDKL